MRELGEAEERNREEEVDEGCTSASARALNGVSSDGFTTTLQPTARAGETLRVTIARGKFHWKRRKEDGRFE